MTIDDLPPLPDMRDRRLFNSNRDGTPEDWHGFTVKQMQEYALSSILASRQQEAPPDDGELDDLAHGALQEALSFGLNHDVFLRYFKTVWKRAKRAAPQETKGPALRGAIDAAISAEGKS